MLYKYFFLFGWELVQCCRQLFPEKGAEVLGFLRESVQRFGQTVVMVTHDPNAASYADRVIFLADGRVVDELRNPTAEGVLDTMKRLDTLAGVGAES